MSWGKLLGNLTSDLLSGRGVGRAVRNAQYTLGRTAGEAVSKSVEASLKAKAEASESEESSFVLIRAMIAAAGADGEVDAEERKAIMDKAHAAGCTPDQITRIEQELKAPASPEQIAAGAQGNSPEVIYRLSLAAITLDDAAEFAHLRRLKKALNLSDTVVQTLHAEMGAPAPQ